MLTIEVATWGATLFGREHGAAVRRELITQIGDEVDVVLSFKGVDRMSLSFADECFGELVDDLARRMTPPHISFAAATPDARASLHFVMRERSVERLSA